MKMMIKQTVAALGLIAATLNVDAAWSTAGDALDQAGTLTLTTAYLDVGDPDTPFNLSGTAAADIGDVESLAGLPAHALDLGDDAGTEGSLAWQSFNVAAGDTLSFTWRFSSLETGSDYPQQDHAFVVMAGQLQTLATSFLPGNVSNSFSHTFSSAGLVAVAVGVVDTVDYLGVSTLQVSELQISPVPEPASALLLLAGGAALLSRRGSFARH